MRFQTLRLPSLAAGAVLLLGLTACAGDTSDNGSSAGGTASQGATSNGTTGTSPEEALNSGKQCVEPGEFDNSKGTFTFAFTTETRSYDPNQIGAASDLLYLFPIYDRLIIEDSKGGLQPGLAEKWDVADGKITLTLRTDAKFHDGTPIDAAAVVANLEHARTLEGGFSRNALSPVTSVEATGDHEVVISIESSPVSVTAALAGAAGMVVNPAALELDHMEMAKTGGSGAFKLLDVQSGAEVRYERVADYWDTEAYGFKELVIKIIGDVNARLNAALTGQVDATMGSDSMVKTAEEQGLETCYEAVVSAIALSMNTNRAEFANPKVREALNYAIDREGISEVVYGGMCQANSQRFPSWFRAANPEIASDHFAYDPERAKELMKESGVESFSFDMYTPGDVGTYLKLGEVLKQQFAEIGVTANIVPSELQGILEAFRVTKEADSHIAPIVTTEPVSYLETFYLADGLNNPGGYEADGMAELFTQLRDADTAEEQEPIFAEVATLVTEEAYPQVIICNQVSSYIASEKVGGLELFYNNLRDFRNVTIND